MTTAGQSAFVDESFHEAPVGGIYVLAAAMFDAACHELARAAMLEIRGKRKTAKPRWSEMDDQQRRNATKIVRTVAGARLQLPKGSRFRVEHKAGAAEPLFWAADIVAGAVRAGRQGEARYRPLLEHCVYEIDLSTGC